MSVIRDLYPRVLVPALGIGVESVKVLPQIINQRRDLTLPYDSFPIFLSLVDEDYDSVFHLRKSFQ